MQTRAFEPCDRHRASLAVQELPLGRGGLRLLLVSLVVLAGPACAERADHVEVYLLDEAAAIHLTDDPGVFPATALVTAKSALIVTAAPPQRVAMSVKSQRDRAKLGVVVAAVAQRYGISARLIDAVIAAESGYRIRAVSVRGALGLMQLMPMTARGYGVVDAFDMAQNIDAGTRHLRAQMDRFRGDTALALAAYNAGAEAVARHGNRIPPYAETTAYVSRVLAHLSSTSSAQ